MPRRLARSGRGVGARPAGSARDAAERPGGVAWLAMTDVHGRADDPRRSGCRPRRIALSTASAYPQTCADAFALRRRPRLRRGRGDGLDRSGQPGPRRAGRLCRSTTASRARRARAHAAGHPAGLGPRAVGQGGPVVRAGPWRSGPRTVVVHPPFRWQREYAAGLRRGRRRAEPSATASGWPWRTCTRGGRAAARCWPTCRAGTRCRSPTEHVTLDLSHTATVGVDALQMARDLGDRLAHLHLADGLGLGQGRAPGARAAATSRAASVLGTAGRAGLVRDGRGRGEHPALPRPRAEREADLAESLAFARLHLAAASAPSRREPAGRAAP